MIVMGFFSSRKAEQLETDLHDDNTVVRVIRSRFYGKAKGKQRSDMDGDASYSPSPPSPSSSFVPFGVRKSFSSTTPRVGISSSSRDLRWTGDSVASSLSRRADNVSEPAASRSSTDAVTITLAQRLNELATANSEGLLSDEVYRLLRQNLFERFASSSGVPSETPLVRMSGVGLVADGRTASSSSHERRPSSNFHVQVPRSPSVRSKKSLSSAVTSLLRRATSKRVASMPAELGRADAVSVFSMASSTNRSNTVPRTLSNQTSNSSLRTQSSRVPTFKRPSSIAADQDTDGAGPSTRPVRGRKRSGSTAPPSSFPGASLGLDQRYTHHVVPDGLPDDDELETAKDIRNQIELVEAEGRRLLDAFNGLELSTLTRRKRQPPVIPPLPFSNSNEGIGIGVSTNTLDRQSLRAGKDIDTLSFKSSGSIRTAHSMTRSQSGPRKMRTATSSTTLTSQPSMVIRKGSISSMSSRGRPGLGTLSGLTGLASSSSVNLTKSSGHLPLATVAETEGCPQVRRARGIASNGSSVSSRGRAWSANTTVNGEDEEILAMETELADIRRRRVEVTARYEARLEYLRARLKGAELREKILRK
ncbi:hypothetical protein AcW2_007250 [Taiwanofungus camphoratus]|nr:hypothetical protein AcW2_007250 [Antrodia cinnamomea]